MHFLIGGSDMSEFFVKSHDDNRDLGVVTIWAIF